MSINTVRLKDGSEVPSPLVASSMLVLRAMAESESITDKLELYELTMAARDPRHQFFGDYADRLASRGFVSAGQVHQSVAKIVRNAVIGEDPGMTDWQITSPLDLERQP